MMLAALVLGWFFKVVTGTGVVLLMPGPASTEELCNGWRMEYFHMMLEDNLHYNIEPCFSAWVDPKTLDEMRGLPP
jgi:hypothetical protein